MKGRYNSFEEFLEARKVETEIGRTEGDFEVFLADGNVTEREGKAWILWYKNTTSNSDDNTWYRGTAWYVLPIDRPGTDDNAISWLKAVNDPFATEEQGDTFRFQQMTLLSYTTMILEGMFSEHEPVDVESDVPEDVQNIFTKGAGENPFDSGDDEANPHKESPKRRKMRADAAKDQRRMATVRVRAKRARYRECLEVGDVVRVPILKKFRTGSSNPTITGVIYKVFPNKSTFLLMTNVGPLDRKIHRNGLHVEESMTADQLAIPAEAYKLSPLGEEDLLRQLNPMHIAGKKCSCKKVCTELWHCLWNTTFTVDIYILTNCRQKEGPAALADVRVEVRECRVTQGAIVCDRCTCMKY